MRHHWQSQQVCEKWIQKMSEPWAMMLFFSGVFLIAFVVGCVVERCFSIDLEDGGDD